MEPRHAPETDMNTVIFVTLHAMWDTNGVEAHREYVKLTERGLESKQLVNVRR